MARYLTGIDHAMVAVRDLDAAAAAWGRLGFTLTPRGVHAEWGTANRCVMFASDYIEMIAPAAPGRVSDKVNAFTETHGEGLYALGLASEDAEAAFRRLEAAGVTVAEPYDLTRRIEGLGRAGELKFRVVELPDDALPGINGQVSQHLSLSLERRPEWLFHPNGATGIASVTVAVDDPEAARPGYEAVFGAGSTTATDRTVAVHTGSSIIMLTRPDDVTQIHPDADLEELPAAPALVALSLKVADFEATRRFLQAQGVEHGHDTKGVIRIPPAQAAGVYLEFLGA